MLGAVFAALLAAGTPMLEPLLGPVEVLPGLVFECPGLVQVGNGSPEVGSSILPGEAAGIPAEHYKADKTHFLAARDPKTQPESGPGPSPPKYKEGEVQQGEQKPSAASCMGCCLGK